MAELCTHLATERVRLVTLRLQAHAPHFYPDNPTYGIPGRAAGNVVQGGSVNPPRNRKGETGNPPPTGARASALPDRGCRVMDP